MSKKDTSKKTTWEKLAEVQPDPTQTETAETKESDIPSESKSQKKLTHPTHEALENQLLETEKKLEDYKSQLIQYKYQLAESKNIQQRIKLEGEKDRKFALAELIKGLLPIKDSLEAALALTTKESDPVLSGIQLTQKQLQNLLSKMGVKSIEPASGDRFDSHFHEAMLTEENETLPPNTIVKVLQKGYLLHDRLMRPALVVVAKVKESTSS